VQGNQFGTALPDNAMRKLLHDSKKLRGVSGLSFFALDNRAVFLIFEDDVEGEVFWIRDC
jgi:hypothetical protein